MLILLLSILMVGGLCSSNSPTLGSVVPDPQCDVSKGCISDCKDGLCTYQVSWQYSPKTNTIMFELQYKITQPGDTWAAVAFSPENRMANNSVIGCLTINGNVKVAESYNTQFNNIQIDNSTLGLRVISAKLEDSVIKCTFNRSIIVNDPKGQVFDLDDPLYVFVGTGPVKDGQIAHHKLTPVMSDEKINLKQTVWTTVSPTTSPAPGPIVPDPQCGVTKKCMDDCTNAACTYLVSWSYISGATEIEFDIQYQISNNGDNWAAIAFSTQSAMVNNSVIACITVNGEVTVAESYNTNHDNQPVKNGTLGLTVLSATYADTIMHCKFRRAIFVNDPDGMVFNLQSPLYLFVGTGPAFNGTLAVHINTPIMSTDLIHFTQPTQETTTTPQQTTSPTTGPILPDPQCDVTKRCMYNCTNGACTYLVSWTYVPGAAEIEFEIQYQILNNGDNWAAIAFSSQAAMVNNSVIACITNNSEVIVAESYNMDHSNQPVKNGTLGITVLSARYADTIIQCKFRRAIIVNDPDGMVFNIHTPLYLFVGTGPAFNGSLAIHTLTPVMSAELIDFTKPSQGTTTISGQTTSTTGPIVRDPQCYVTKGCMDDCSNGACTYLVSWSYTSSTTEIEFEIKYQISASGDNWAAIAFSTEAQMVNNSVIACITNNGEVDVAESYNTNFNNQPVQNSKLGLTVLAATYADSIIRCKFSRSIVVNDPDGMVFNLNSPLYLFVGTGPASNGHLAKHKSDPIMSPGLFDFTQTSWTTTARVPTTSTGAPGVITLDSECKKTKGCFYVGNPEKLPFLITWRKIESSIEFEIKAIVGEGQPLWAAIGLGTTDKMSDSSVIACVNTGDSVTVQESYNKGHSNMPIQDNTLGIDELSSSLQDSIIRCTFKRTIDPNDPQLFSLNKKWYLLFAHGVYSTSADRLLKHTADPIVSPSKINFTSTASVVGEGQDKTLVKLHACLMIVAWMCLASIGIVVARYYKKQWPKLLYFHHKVWFLIHRTCMIFAALCTFASIVIIFLKVKGYSEIEPQDEAMNYEKSHPIIGIYVTALTVINPLMAFFRPHHDSRNRPLFNWLHFGVGVLAHILASINIFFGLQLEESGAPPEATYVAAAYASTFVIVEGLLELHSRGTYTKVEQAKMRNEHSGLLDSDKPEGISEHSQFKSALLYLHIFSMIGFSVATIYLLVNN